MKPCVNIISFIFAFVCVSDGYEEGSLPNLTAPAVIKPMAVEVQIQHQFWGRVEGKDNVSRLFGIGDGADIRIGARASLLPQTQVFAFYDNIQLFSVAHNEFSAGASYALFLSNLHLRMQVESEVFSYASQVSYPEIRKTGVFIQGCFQNDPLFNRIELLCNVGYNFNRKKPGLGIGCDVAVTESFDVYGEYFPILAKTDVSFLQGDAVDPFSFGVKITTYGHQFFLYASNALEIGSRHMMLGTTDNYIRFGFMLKRLFHFSSTHS